MRQFAALAPNVVERAVVAARVEGEIGMASGHRRRQVSGMRAVEPEPPHVLRLALVWDVTHTTLWRAEARVGERQPAVRVDFHVVVSLAVGGMLWRDADVAAPVAHRVVSDRETRQPSRLVLPLHLVGLVLPRARSP